MSLAALLFPTLRWDPQNGFAYLEEGIADAIALGVGGFVIHGGPRAQVAALTAALHASAKHPLLIAAEAEAGAGQQFVGCTQLPPLGALGMLALADDSGIARRAARITARELRAIGINWALAPVCDLDLPPGTPMASVRSPGARPDRVAPFIAEWVDACQAEGVLACAKHFPGLGRARGDSYLGPTTVAERPEEIWRSDLAPFRAAIDAGVATVIAAHGRFPTLDRRDLPASLSAPILGQLLREAMEFDGLIASDSVDMRAVLALGTESEVCVSALAAGCDVLLGVGDPHSALQAVERAVKDGALDRERVDDALARRARWALWGAPALARETSLDDVMWARQTADRAVHVVRGTAPRLGSALEVIVVDEDATGPWPARERGVFERALRSLEMDAPVVAAPTPHTKVPVIVALYAEVIAWKGFDSPSIAARAAVAAARAAAVAQQRECCVVLFGHPRHVQSLGDVPNVVCAWSGDAVMQEAAARALARGLLH